MGNSRMSSWQRCGGCLIVEGILTAGCALRASPVQMYEGPSLPKEQVSILRSACKTTPGLTIMIMRIDDKDVRNGCGVFSLLPGDHQLELSAKQLAPRIDTPMIRSGSATGPPPSTIGASQDEDLPVIWASSSPLRLRSTRMSGQVAFIVGTAGGGRDGDARCRERAP